MVRRFLCPLAPVLALALWTVGGCSRESVRGEEGPAEGGDTAPAPDQDAGPDGGELEVPDAAGQDVPEAPDAGAPDAGDPWANRARTKDGFGLRPVTPPSERIVIVFVSRVGEGETRRLQYWVGMPGMGGLTRSVPLAVTGSPSLPVVSSDGDFAAFIEAGGGVLFKVDLRIPEVQEVYVPPRGVEVGNPVLGLRGRYLVATERQGGMSRVVRFDTSLAEEPRAAIWEQAGQVGVPAMSDDGGTVLFHFLSAQGSPGEIWEWKEGNHLRAVTDSPAVSDVEPSISRDGRTYCWRATRGPQSAAILLYDATTGKSRDITTARPGLFTNNTSCQVEALGRRTVFRTNRGALPPGSQWLQKGRFAVYDANADEARLLPEPEGLDPDGGTSPWRLSSDGRWIVFTATPSGMSSTELFAMSSRDGTLYRLTETPEDEGRSTPGVN